MSGINGKEHRAGKILKKPYPKVIFKIDQGMDKYVAEQFLEETINPINFNEHPNLRKALEYQGLDRQKIISDYVSKYYETHEKELETTRLKFQQVWDEVEPNFFDITSRIFDNYEWPIGNYITYPSIFNCNPRFLDTKTFQVYRKNVVGTVYSTAHEMLHFIFYDYMKKNEKDYVEKLGEDGLWALSEVFNEIAFEQPEYGQFKPKVPSSYQHLQPLTTKFRDATGSKPFSIKSFIIKAKQIKF